MLIMLFSSIVTFSSPLKVTSGKANFMKTQANAVVYFYWDEATWDKKMPLAEQFKDDYDSYITNGEKHFVAGFSQASKKLRLVDNTNEASYKIEVMITNVDKYFSAMSFVPGMKYKVWAIIKVTNISSGEIVCKVKVTEFVGGRDFKDSDAFTECMKDLGEAFAKLK